MKIAIVSGKGRTGETIIVTNLAVSLSQAGRRVQYQGRLCGIVSFFGGLRLGQFRSPLGGFVGFGPRLVEGHKLL
jgi:hypothetical protein